MWLMISLGTCLPNSGKITFFSENTAVNKAQIQVIFHSSPLSLRCFTAIEESKNIPDS